ncbi:MAG TPA: polysaccharide deacetylase family protein [Flavisolibacter sp.]|nr:polysaccharide deacetylase family protein [Flavisolibacter sp.]
MSQSALIFCHSITPRLQYVIDFLSQYYEILFRPTSDEEKYLKAQHACKINYSYHRLSPGEIFIHAHVLLTESYVRPVKVECFDNNGYPAFFKTEGEPGFDLFAAIFFLLTRYEEYLPHKKDKFGRFSHRESVAFKNDFLHLPLINIWLEHFRDLMKARNADCAATKKAFSFTPTYDIDMAWSFRNKGFKRNAGALSLLFVQGKFRKLVQRIRVLQGRLPDPFDAYEWMDDLHRLYNSAPLYFILMARERSRLDKNIDVTSAPFQLLVRDLSSKYEIGIHPSWASGDLPSLLTTEKSLLEAITGKKVNCSRQHFIRFDLPQSYHRLLALDIHHDYSMGYGSINGFRASVTTPFLWYDLKHEETSKLLLHPFCFMDANAYYEQKLSAQKAFDELMEFYRVIKSVNGKMVTIWHNSFLGTDKAFAGWRDMYAEFVATTSANS